MVILHLETCSVCGGRGGYYADENPYADPGELISFPSFWHSCFDCEGTGYDLDFEERVIGWIKSFSNLTDKNEVIIAEKKASEALTFLHDNYDMAWGKNYMAAHNHDHEGIIMFRFDDDIVATAFKLKFYEGETLC